MKNFAIVPLDTHHVDEICNDIKYQIDNKIAHCAPFTPGFDPVYEI